MKCVGVIDTGAGNIRSLMQALRACEREPILLAQPDTIDLNTLSALVLPGQGRFGPVMQVLRQHDWCSVIASWLAENRRLLGICVGLQVLFEASEEDPHISGLGLLPGRIRRLQSPKQPMMGWAEIENRQAEKSAMYFVNSYVAEVGEYTIASCEYGQRFSAAVQRDSLVACQFHPEKSGAAGLAWLQQWLY